MEWINWIDVVVTSAAGGAAFAWARGREVAARKALAVYKLEEEHRAVRAARQERQKAAKQQAEAAARKRRTHASLIAFVELHAGPGADFHEWAARREEAYQARRARVGYPAPRRSAPTRGLHRTANGWRTV